jgi:hypothetical protein
MRISECRSRQAGAIEGVGSHGEGHRTQRLLAELCPGFVIVRFRTFAIFTSAGAKLGDVP